MKSCHSWSLRNFQVPLQDRTSKEASSEFKLGVCGQIFVRRQVDDKRAMRWMWSGVSRDDLKTLRGSCDHLRE
jgi:hypothetical protein